MSFMLWQSQGAARIASPRLVLRATEVPALADAQALCGRLADLERNEQERLNSAAAEARALGHAEGMAEGRRAARDEVAAKLLALARGSERERERLRRDTAVLALQVVRKLLGQFADDELLAALAATAAAEALPSQQLTLLIHPDIADAVRDRLAARAQADAARIEVRADPCCAPDCCRLETEHGSIDASLDGQLQRLAQAWSQPATEAAE